MQSTGHLFCKWFFITYDFRLLKLQNKESPLSWLISKTIKSQQGTLRFSKKNNADIVFFYINIKNLIKVSLCMKIFSAKKSRWSYYIDLWKAALENDFFLVSINFFHEFLFQMWVQQLIWG